MPGCPRLEREARMKPELRASLTALQAAREVLDSGRADQQRAVARPRGASATCS